jgi:hypothetical protein
MRVIVAVSLVGTCACTSLGQDSEKRASAVLIQSLPLLLKPEVAKELDITKDQRSKLDELVAERQAINDEAIVVIRPESTASKEERSRAQAAFLSRMLELDGKIEKLLLPHQLLRISQLQFQLQTRAYATSFGMLSPRVKESLQLSDQQVEEVAGISIEYQESVKKRMEQLRKDLEVIEGDARRRMIKCLSDSQSEKYEKLAGPPFSVEVLLRRDETKRPP